MTAEWGSDDAVVLTAIDNVGQCDLVALIGGIDACNHDVMPEREFATAVGRLVGSSLVTVADGPRFCLTSSGTALTGQRRGGTLAGVDSIRRLLTDVQLVEWDWAPPAGEYSAAVARYLSSRSSPGSGVW